MVETQRCSRRQEIPDGGKERNTKCTKFEVSESQPIPRLCAGTEKTMVLIQVPIESNEMHGIDQMTSYGQNVKTNQNREFYHRNETEMRTYRSDAVTCLITKAESYL